MNPEKLVSVWSVSTDRMKVKYKYSASLGMKFTIDDVKRHRPIGNSPGVVTGEGLDPS